MHNFCGFDQPLHIIDLIVFTGREIPNATSFLFRFLINHEIPRSRVDFTPQLVFFSNKPRVVHTVAKLSVVVVVIPLDLIV